MSGQGLLLTHPPPGPDKSGARFDAAGNLSDLGEAFAKIAEEMRSLYTLGYVPSNSEKDGKFRKIKVEVNIDKGRVRTRQGYYSGKK